jgi:cephalosporin hydroxylase
MCDLVGNGHILTVDIDEFDRPEHPRITYLTGSSVDAEIVADVRRRTAEGSRMVILDSDHSREHVTRELDAYHDLVTPEDYLIVEDTNISGHPIPSSYEGPWEAVTEFLERHPKFRPDTSREKFYVTANPRGYLKRQH